MPAATNETVAPASRFSTSLQRTIEPSFRSSRKRHAIERGAEHLLARCRLIGAQAGAWAEAMQQNRDPQSLRVMLGLLHLAQKHPAADLEKAAGSALHHGAWRLRDLKRLLELPGNVVQLDFLQAHPLIRPLEAYRIAPASRHHHNLHSSSAS